MKPKKNLWRVAAATAAAVATLLGGGVAVSSAVAADGTGLAHAKTITPEGDGYRISLTANNKQWSLTKPVDVLTLVDHSASMFDEMGSDAPAPSDDVNRWHYLHADLTRLSETLFDGTNRMGAVTFGQVATNHSYGNNQYFTTNRDAWLNSIGHPAMDTVEGAATNWEDAFIKANTILGQMNNDHEKYIVFLTDGQPNGYIDENGDPAKHEGDFNQPTTTRDFKEAVAEAKQVFATHKDIKLLSVGAGAEVAALKEFQKQVTGSEAGYYDGSNPDNLEDAFNDIIVSAISPLVISDTLSANVDYAGDLKVVDGAGKPVPASQYSAQYNQRERRVNVTFNGSFKPVNGQTYTASFKVKPSQTAYDTLAAANGKYPATGDAGTGSISAGKPGLYTNGRASVTYNDQGNPVTLEYPKPVEQVTLTSLTAKRAGDCKTDGLTIHLWKDGKDTGVKATLGKNGEHVFANLAPGHEYETKADPVADNSCTVPTVTPPSYEPKPGDKPGTSTVTANQSPANLVYDKNAENATGKTDGYEGHANDTVTINPNGFSYEGYEFDGWNTGKDGKGTAHKRGDKIVLPAGTTTLYAQWKEIPGTLSWAKTDKETGKVLAGSEWDLADKQGQTVHVTDNGELDQAEDEGAFKLTGLKWGEYTLTETKAPAGHDKLTEPIGLTIDAQHTTVSLGDVTNSRTPATVHYDPNGGQGHMDDHKGFVGDTPEAGDNKFTNKDECKEFAGWNTQADGKGKTYQSKDQVDPLTGDITLYAQWKTKDNCPAPAAAQPNELGKTGSSVLPYAFSAVLLLLSGGALLVLRRQRHGQHA
ncbi:DUF7604 domain-containing protein [Bifidobacterium tibiigranuli]|jgi:uncharacterized repeat protein (TIGR02543 family)|uniref:DUF7604 domain-containing protein n=1 Tax=Bifidobacterium tibiigranuli TaxID=2172043 RepID=UPI002353CADC|nr:InlB B-repeat-containing protein [Bifidobacterium tibiigranuli]MCI1211141.1 InlB B-repeat-containing protein [Bifidobacterium tibiigranuli]MCI1220348.1 InlB B-repeat-containing protein [Bifidobacterium tibiigranuli]MCI1231969.1 InlB B-repeat-containing protein [Bifidobacterium tibiigranuli]